MAFGLAVNPANPLSDAARWILSSQKFGPSGTVRLQHFAVLSLMVNITTPERPITVDQFAKRYLQKRAGVARIFKTLAEHKLLEVIVRTAAHGKGRAYYYYSTYKTIDEAIHRELAPPSEP